MENLTGGTPPVRYLPCVVPCKLYFMLFHDNIVDQPVVLPPAPAAVSAQAAPPDAADSLPYTLPTTAALESAGPAV